MTLKSKWTLVAMALMLYARPVTAEETLPSLTYLAPYTINVAANFTKVQVQCNFAVENYRGRLIKYHVVPLENGFAKGLIEFKLSYHPQIKERDTDRDTLFVKEFFKGENSLRVDCRLAQFFSSEGNFHAVDTGLRPSLNLGAKIVYEFAPGSKTRSSKSLTLADNELPQGGVFDTDVIGNVIPAAEATVPAISGSNLEGLMQMLQPDTGQ